MMTISMTQLAVFASPPRPDTTVHTQRDTVILSAVYLNDTDACQHQNV